MRASAPLVLSWSGFEAVSVCSYGFQNLRFAQKGSRVSWHSWKGLRFLGQGFRPSKGRGSDRTSGLEPAAFAAQIHSDGKIAWDPSCFENSELSLPDTQRWKVCLRTFHAFRTKSLRRNQTLASHAGKDTSTIGEHTRAGSCTRQPSPPTRLIRTTVHRVLVIHRQGLRFA